MPAQYWVVREDIRKYLQAQVLSIHLRIELALKAVDLLVFGSFLRRFISL